MRDHEKLDIANQDLVNHDLRDQKPDYVINCAAWTDVDACEGDAERAFAANARGPENLSLAAREIDAGVITISTDYVFDGTKSGFYTQRDNPNPQSVYGKSKLEGERRAQLAHARTIVVRTGYVFGSGGNNFLSKIIDYAQSGKPLKAISDAYGTPTYAVDLAIRLRQLAELDLPGTYHVVNAGEGANFEEFARVALKAAALPDSQVESIHMDSLDRPAPRPRNSRLKCLLSEAVGLAPLPLWKESVEAFVAQTTGKSATAEG